MKKILSTIVALSFASTVFAAGTATIVLPASMGNVSFPHVKHQQLIKDCTKCHTSKEGGKIEGFGKDLAHKTCKGCHAESGKGPTSCKDCHKK